VALVEMAPEMAALEQQQITLQVQEETLVLNLAEAQEVAEVLHLVQNLLVK
jgi:hypothetical protein